MSGRDGTEDPGAVGVPSDAGSGAHSGALGRALAAVDRFINPERLRAYSIILVIGYAAGIAVLLAGLRHGLDAQGKPPGADFIIFYGVSKLTLAGQALGAYAPHLLLAAERAIFPASRGVFVWTYPPPFQLVVTPLSLVPYGWALAGWTAAGLAIYLIVVKRAAGGARAALLPALAFPGVFMNATQGQTGFLLTGLMGGGLLLIKRRPWFAGVLLGLLAVKPQFGLLLPLVCLAGGRWQTAAAGAGTALAVSAVATLAFGAPAWIGFLKAAALSGDYLAAGALPVEKDPSVFAALILLGAPVLWALVIHLIQAAVAVILAWPMWRRGPADMAAAAAILATLIALPYLFDYDLALLAVPIAVAARRAGAEAPIGSRTALIYLAVLPIVLAPLGKYAHTPLGPAVLWAGLLALRSMWLGSMSLEPALAAVA
ncbi:MAG TPA: glycosyltransferase family 87 protein [Caulobacteraceae bacterium]